MKKKLLITLLSLLMLFMSSGLAGCTNTGETTSSAAAAQAASGTTADTSGEEGTSAADVRVLTFAYTAEGVPYAYTDEDGNATGSDIEILKLIDEELPDYEFQFVATSYDDIYIGLQAGTYDGGLTNSFYTEERNEKYLIPTENLGGSLAGLLVRKENADVVTLADVADQGLKLVPMKSGDGMTYQIEAYNEENPDHQITIEYTSDTNSWNLAAGWIAEGRYDVASTLKTSWESTVVAEDGAYHQYYDDLSFTVYKTIKTYPMLSRATLDEDFVQLFEDTLKKLKEDGRASEIAEKFYGEDIFSYTYTEGR